MIIIFFLYFSKRSKYLKKINHIAIAVSNIEESAKFNGRPS